MQQESHQDHIAHTRGGGSASCTAVPVVEALAVLPEHRRGTPRRGVIPQKGEGYMSRNALSTEAPTTPGSDDCSSAPPFVPCDQFIVTAFARRFQALLASARYARSSHVVSAPPGSGKTWGICDLVLQSGAKKTPNGSTRLPIVATCAPTNNGTEQALGVALAECFGTTPVMPWSRMRVWLVSQLARAQVELIVIDDAHDLSIAHLKFLKEIWDRLRLPPYNATLSLCLVAASFGAENDLVTHLSRPEMLWQQFRRRLDPRYPFCTVPGHTEAEVLEVLAAFERYYRTQGMPYLNLVPWTSSIYGYLVHPTLDPTGSKRATMDNITKFVNLTVEAAWLLCLDDVTEGLIYQTAQMMTLTARPDTVFDGDPQLGSFSTYLARH